MTKQAGDYIDDLRAQLAGARSALVREEARTRRLVRQRDDARYNARILAHAYTTDNRPPAKVVDEALAYPKEPEAPTSAWQKGNPVVEVRGSRQHDLSKIVDDAAERFDARPLYRASVEARAELGGKHPACLSDCRGEGCCGGCRT